MRAKRRSASASGAQKAEAVQSSMAKGAKTAKAGGGMLPAAVCRVFSITIDISIDTFLITTDYFHAIIIITLLRLLIFTPQTLKATAAIGFHYSAMADIEATLSDAAAFRGLIADGCH